MPSKAVSATQVTSSTTCRLESVLAVWLPEDKGTTRIAAWRHLRLEQLKRYLYSQLRLSYRHRSFIRSRYLLIGFLYLLLSSSSLTLFEQGLFYFVAHPFLYPLLRTRLLPAFLLSIFVLGNLFFWTYLPQVAFLAIFHYAGAWLNGTFLVLGEGAAIVAILFEAFFVVLCPTLALGRFSTTDIIERTSLSSTSLTRFLWKRGLRTLSLREGRLL